jgi:mannose-6-phosphate isomerase class I
MQLDLNKPPHAHTPPGVYDLYPTFPIPEGQIKSGFTALAKIIAEAIQGGARHIAIDGFGGVLWADLRAGLDAELRQQRIEVSWQDTSSCFLPENELAQIIADNLGGDDPIFGRLCERELVEFFDDNHLRRLENISDDGLIITYGAGAALVGRTDVLIYADVPKDVIQQRMSAKTITNLGLSTATINAVMYKRFYFVDWPVLNRHKADLLPRINWFVDIQNPAQPRVMSGEDLRNALSQMTVSSFRARPWFAPGPWGGQWMKQHFDGLMQDVPNYAWSFELIVPENGIVFQSADERLEASFDVLMFQHYRDILGQAADQFGYNFPIRFDYLDTFEGGNLSVQCHPRPEYIRQHFGEPFTQDESYYITTCQPGAQVYLGFRDGADPQAFRAELERSQREGVMIDIERFVNTVSAHPHDIFLIPSGTIHGSGMNNLVLEISATPYIYTFKIYDWMRRDLEGHFRPLNIDRAFHNLYFDRQEQYVNEYLCPQPIVTREGAGWREVFVGTHEALFYAVYRYEFDQTVEATTDGRCHILNVVEGEGVIVETANGYRALYNFAETFIVPAAAEHYRLIPVGKRACKVVFAFVK